MAFNPRPVTPATVARLVYGIVLMTGAGHLSRGGDNRRFRAVVRMLGACHVLQAVALARWPTPVARRAGAVVDTMHAATDLGYALVDSGRRGAALGDASVAAAFACSDLLIAAGRDQ